MTHSTTIGLKRHGLAVLLAMLLLTGLLASPQRVGAAEPGEDSPPTISNWILTPGILSFEGGEVSIGADVVDDIGVVSAYAEVIGSDGTYYSVQMTPTGVTSYSASVDIPPNFSEGEIGYSVYVSASDTNGAYVSELVGDIQVPAPPQFDESPTVSDPSVEPRQLPAAGGSVVIQATASDNRSVSYVYATVALPGGGSTEVPLEAISSSRFEGVFTAPPNAGTTTLQYGIQITALDDIGQPGSVDAGVFSVAPLPAPAAGQLVVSPGSRSFGRVWVGGRAWRLLRVRNVGSRGTAPIEGVIRASGAPFSLLGETPEGIRFRLRPRETRFYLVAFRPGAVGLQTGSVTVQRSDGGQPGLTVQLSGQGVSRR
jgi:hypothetical protein